MGGGVAVQQRADLAGGPRLTQRVQQPGYGGRVVEAGVGGGVAVQQRGDLAGGPRRTQIIQQVDHGVGVIEAGVGGGPVGRALIAGVQSVEQPDEASPGPWIAMGAGLLVQAGRVTVQAAVLGSPPECAQVGWVSVAGCGRPERCRRGQQAAGPAAVLVEIVGQLPGLPVAGAGRETRAWAGADGRQRPADPLGGPFCIAQPLLQPVVGQQIPVSVGQIPGRRRFQKGPR